MSSRRKRTRQEVGNRNTRPRIPLAPGGAAAGGGAAGGGAAASAATKPSKLPDTTIGRDPLRPNKDYIWEDADGWLPLDWAGRKEGFRLQQEARFNTQYNPRRQNNYVDLTQRPGTPLNRYRDQVDLTGPETAEEEAIDRLQQQAPQSSHILRVLRVSRRTTPSSFSLSHRAKRGALGATVLAIARHGVPHQPRRAGTVFRYMIMYSKYRLLL